MNSRAKVSLFIVLLLACGDVTVEKPPPTGGGGAGGSGGDGGNGGCDGATCLADEVCGYEPSAGCDADRVCAKKNRYPDCPASWYVCSCGAVTEQVQVRCPEGLTDVPANPNGVCPPM